MTTLKASTTRIPTKIFNQVAFRNERAVIERRDGEKVILISSRELEIFEAYEKYIDNIEADRALAEMIANKETPIPLAQVKAELGL